MMNPFPRMHVSLYVSDMNKTTAFYTAFFGAAPVKVRHGYAKYILNEPSLIISFVENHERVKQNFGHLGFQVETIAELNARLEQAQQSGLVTREENGTNCCYATQDKFWVTDPTTFNGKCITSTPTRNLTTRIMRWRPPLPAACLPRKKKQSPDLKIWWLRPNAARRE